jgi:hypothetical protein
MVLFLFTLTSPAVIAGALQTVRLEKKLTKLTSPAVITVDASRMLWLEKKPMTPHARR